MGSGVVPNSAGSNRISTNLTFDTSNVLGSVSGLVQTNGVSAWWFANDSLMDSGVAWISWGDMSLRYDASRVSLGYSGWVFANQLGGVGDIFDTKNVSMTASTSGLVSSLRRALGIRRNQRRSLQRELRNLGDLYADESQS